jgi:uncharacterized membrane protein
MGTRGGRPEPQAAAARTAGKNAQRSKQGNRKPGTGRPGSGQSGAGAAAQSAKNPAAKNPAGKNTAAKNTAARPAQQPGPGRWFQWTTLVLSLAGLGVSIYLTIAHYTESALAACPESSTINCAKVTTSPESIVFGIFPVAVLGLAFYLFMVAVNSPWAWRSLSPAISWARLVSVVIGICFVLYLIFVELFVVNAICLWCTSVHVLTFLLFAFTVFSAATWGLNRPAAGRE